MEARHDAPDHAGASRRVLACVALGAALLAPVRATTPDRETDPTSDLAAARELFQRNLQAIRDQDREAYLACYLESPELVRTGPDGPSLGYEGFAAGAGGDWPEVFQGRDLQLVPIRPGVVYGTYRYRIVQDGVPSSGLSERLFVATPQGWRIAVTTAFPAAPGIPPPPLALVGATLVDGTGRPPVADSVVLIRGGRIDCAGGRQECTVPPGIETLDLAGRYLTPGLIDAHVHLSQSGWVDGRPDAVDVRDRYPYAEVVATLAARPERFFRAYLCSGVTGVFDVGGYPWTWRLIGRSEGDPWAPHVEAAGPLLSTVDSWLNLPGERQFDYMENEETVRRAVAYHAAFGSKVVKVWYVPTPRRPTATLAALVRLAGAEAHARGMRFIVHATGLAEATEAVGAGADVLVHSITDRQVDDAFLDLALRQGTILVPTLIVHQGYVEAAGGTFHEDRYPLDCVDPLTLARARETATLHPNGPNRERLLQARARSFQAWQIGSANLVRLHKAGIPIALGTDAGNPLTLHGPSIHAELEAMERAGLSPTEVLVAATRDAARAMGRDQDLGTLEAGKVADLLILDEDPTRSAKGFRSLRQVIRAGVVHDRSALLPSPSGDEPRP